MPTLRFHSRTLVLTGLLVALVPLLGTADVSAVAQAGGGAGGLRAYWHIFIAYAIAIVAVGGWAVSIARRLRDVERRLD